MWDLMTIQIERWASRAYFIYDRKCEEMIRPYKKQIFYFLTTEKLKYLLKKIKQDGKKLNIRISLLDLFLNELLKGEVANAWTIKVSKIKCSIHWPIQLVLNPSKYLRDPINKKEKLVNSLWEMIWDFMNKKYKTLFEVWM